MFRRSQIACVVLCDLGVALLECCAMDYASCYLYFRDISPVTTTALPLSSPPTLRYSGLLSVLKVCPAPRHSSKLAQPEVQCERSANTSVHVTSASVTCSCYLSTYVIDFDTRFP